MGLMWRYLWLYPYCKLDDIVLFHNRWHRVYVAFAGTFVSLLIMIPFALLWYLLPVGHPCRLFSALMLTSYNIGSLFNLVPFVQLDGYFMLSHALGMSDLRKESRDFLIKLAKQRLLGQKPPDGDYSRKERLVYLIYGIPSLLVAGWVIGAMAIFWYSVTAARLGRLLAGIVLGAFCLFWLFRKRVGEWIGRLFKRGSASKDDQAAKKLSQNAKIRQIPQAFGDFPRVLR